MLRFMAKIRQKSGDKSSASFWTFAIGEFVLVFLGILIALQVDNWNQDRKDRKLEKVLLNELLVNLQSDLSDVEYNINYHSRFLKSSEIVLEYLEGSDPYHDSLETHFGNLNGATVFMENISAYESLKSIGIDLISNDTLRQMITNLYSVWYDYILSVEQFAAKHITEIMNPSISEHLYTIDFFDRAYPLDASGIKQSNSFRYNLKMNIRYMEIQIRSYNNAKTQIVNLIEEIEKELL
jgi:hypothetical protein